MQIRDSFSNRYNLGKERCLIYLFSFLFLTVSLLSGCATSGALRKGEQGELKKVSVETTVNGSQQVTIESTSPIRYTAFKLKNPLRLVLDINDTGIGNLGEEIKISQGALDSIKVRRFKDSATARLELMLNSQIHHEVVRPSQNIVRLVIKGEGSTVVAGMIKVKNLSIMKIPEGKMRLLLKTSGDKPKFSLFKTPNLNQLVLDVENAVIPPQVSREVNVSDRSSVVTKIRSFQHKTQARVVIDLAQEADYNIYRDAGDILLDISNAVKVNATKVPTEDGKAILATVTNNKGRHKDALSEVKETAENSNFEEKDKKAGEFTGKMISMDLQKTEIASILKLIADVSGVNIVVSGKADGKITLRLIEVPWDQALDVVLKTAKLGMIRDGNIIRVAPFDVIAAEKEGQISQQTAIKKMEDLFAEISTEIIPVDYAQASELVKNLEKLKGARGDISIDERTNSLIITDMSDNIVKMKKLIGHLDKRTEQVLIEARIVEVNRNYTSELGIEWGGSVSRTNSTSFPANVNVQGSSVGTNIVSLPVAAGSGSGGAISATLGNAAGTASLDLRLTALEANGRARILSTPKIVTSDNKEAVIESGRSIPYATTSSEGTSVQFVDATIRLTVKPHITSDGYISMAIEATKNEADFGNQVQGTPSIIKKSATTNVLILSGDTTVIGGLYKTTTSDSSAGVPFFNKIPILGWLFKNLKKADAGEELLIFITATKVE